jgi:hypothetical protein
MIGDIFIDNEKIGEVVSKIIGESMGTIDRVLPLAGTRPEKINKHCFG